MNIKKSSAAMFSLDSPATAAPIQWRRGSDTLFQDQKRDKNLVILDSESVERFFNLLNYFSGGEAYRMMAQHAMDRLSSPQIATRIPTSGVLSPHAELTRNPPR